MILQNNKLFFLEHESGRASALDFKDAAAPRLMGNTGGIKE